MRKGRNASKKVGNHWSKLQGRKDWGRNSCANILRNYGFGTKHTVHETYSVGQLRQIFKRTLTVFDFK